MYYHFLQMSCEKQHFDFKMHTHLHTHTSRTHTHAQTHEFGLEQIALRN